MSGNVMIYETQFFGFTPQTCMMRMYLAFQDHLCHIMLIIEEVILKKLESMRYTKLTPSSIRRSSEKFLAYMRKHSDQLFGKMEPVLLQVVLTIPENVLLPEDKCQEQYRYTESEFQELQEEICHLEHRVKAEISAQQALKAELEEQKATQEQLEKILQWFDSLDNICREHGTSNLKESFAFLKGNATKLQTVMQEVEDKSKKLYKK
ncbi:protein MIS12 homolog [Heteronotia binoei]|uniref:protein MIS12 homolog n=1 Tax=Heteronotia binoei TaxID=13085 RepID=UPI00292FBA32|nr:protein MIS12 homolog [Heteronotia binoei]XP_060115234.1 protein MIS12 homolog [Heteronotia binoei]